MTDDLEDSLHGSSVNCDMNLFLNSFSTLALRPGLCGLEICLNCGQSIGICILEEHAAPTQLHGVVIGRVFT